MATARNADRLLEVENLDVSYGPIQVVWDITLSVRRGEVVSLIGPNGAGKTTTLRALAGILPTRRGKINFNGRDIGPDAAHRRVGHHLNLVPEGRQLWPRMTVEENLLMGAFSSNLRPKSHQNLERIYGLFPRLKERHKQLCGTLSGGEQQMCAMGRALMAKPKLLMLDEPSLGLSPILVETIFDIVREINAQGTPVLLVEQNAHKALEIANRGYVLETGAIVQTGTGKELLESAEVQKAYLGM